MATKKLPTVAESHRERMAARLVLYRDYVARVARGEAISAEDADLVHKAMDTLGLPSFAFQRDVRAWVVAATADQQRRLTGRGQSEFLRRCENDQTARVDWPAAFPSPIARPNRCSSADMSRSK